MESGAFEVRQDSFPVLRLERSICLGLPCFVMCLRNSSLYLRYFGESGRVRSNEDLLREVRSLFEPVERVLGGLSQWRFLQGQENGYFCEHTFMTLVVLWNNPEFVELDGNSKEILLWTMLFHDLWKRGSPLLPCRDPFHPFSSAAKALEVFVEHGLVDKRSGVEGFCEFIMNSYVLKYTRTEIMDLGKIEEIYKGLLYYSGVSDRLDSEFGSFVEVEALNSEFKRFFFEVLVLILFHQSLELNNRFMNTCNLNVWQVKRYLSKRMVHFLYIVHHADHNSYNVGYHNINEYPNDAQIKENAKRYLALFDT